MAVNQNMSRKTSRQPKIEMSYSKIKCGFLPLLANFDLRLAAQGNQDFPKSDLESFANVLQALALL